jgi:hypothetical protein
LRSKTLDKIQDTIKVTRLKNIEIKEIVILNLTLKETTTLVRDSKDILVFHNLVLITIMAMRPGTMNSIQIDTREWTEIPGILKILIILMTTQGHILRENGTLLSTMIEENFANRDSILRMSIMTIILSMKTLIRKASTLQTIMMSARVLRDRDTKETLQRGDILFLLRARLK